MFSLDRQTAPDPHDLLPTVPSFSLVSSDVADGETVDTQFVHPSVGGENVSPELTWSGFPVETKGFAVTCFDPDAPTGSGFWHWAVINVPVATTNLAQGASGTDAMP
ncbi:MAG: YbhB/YbcL family Raf kinase inhibitor-like protein, partial [Aquihabitans sp.]